MGWISKTSQLPLSLNMISREKEWDLLLSYDKHIFKQILLISDTVTIR